MNWPKQPLGNVAELFLGKMLDEKKNKGQPLPYLGNINVRWGTFDLDNLRQMRFEEHELERYGLKYGDIVMCEGGEPGRCAIWKETVPGMMIQKALHRIRPHEGLDFRYLYYDFLQKGRTGAFAPLFTGATIQHLPAQNLAKIEVAIPPLDVQHRIADILSAYDDLIENNRRRIALLEQAARMLYKEWFVSLRFPGHEHVKVKGGVPEGWEKRRLVDCATIVMGQSPASEHYNTDGDGLPFHQGVTNFGERFVEHKTYCKIEGRIGEAGDILCSVRAPVGRLNITLDRIVIGRGLSAIRSINGYQSFLYYQLKNHFFKEDMIGGGAIFASVTKKDMENQSLLCPPNRLIEDFEQNSKPIGEQLKTLHLQNQKLKQARDLLLPRLMDGEIPV